MQISVDSDAVAWKSLCVCPIQSVPDTEVIIPWGELAGGNPWDGGGGAARMAVAEARTASIVNCMMSIGGESYR